MDNSQIIYGLEMPAASKDVENLFRNTAAANFTLKMTAFRDTVVNTLKDIYSHIADIEINTANDYTDAEVVNITNNGRALLNSLYPVYYDILGCIQPSEIEKVETKIYAVPGGPTGLNLVIQIYGLRSVCYTFSYPNAKNYESADPENSYDVTDTPTHTINFRVTGGFIKEYEKEESEITDANETTKSISAKITPGRYIVYHVCPNDGYTFASVVFDGIPYNDIKLANNIEGLSIAEYTEGYEVNITDTNEDHTIVFNLNRNYELDIYKVHIVSTNSVVTCHRDTILISQDSEHNISTVSGCSFDAKFEPYICTKLVGLKIDGRDYYDDFTEVGLTNYDGKFEDGNIFNLKIKPDGEVIIDISRINMDHDIEVLYEEVMYSIKGILVDQEMNVLVEPLFEFSRGYYSKDNAYEYDFGELLDSTYPDFNLDAISVHAPISVAKNDDVYYWIDYDARILKIDKPKTDIVFFIKIKEKPKIFTIQGNAVNCTFPSSAGYTTNIITSDIPVDSLMGYLITTEYFEDERNQFRIPPYSNTFFEKVKITIDGQLIANAKELANLEMAVRKMDECNMRLVFLRVTADHVFTVELTDECRIPTHEVNYHGIGCSPNYSIDNEYNEIVYDRKRSSAVFLPDDGHALPITDGIVDYSKFRATVNNIVIPLDVPSLSNVIISVVHYDASGEIVLGEGNSTNTGIEVTVNNVIMDYEITLVFPEKEPDDTCEVTFKGINCYPYNGTGDPKVTIKSAVVGDEVYEDFLPDENHVLPIRFGEIRNEYFVLINGEIADRDAFTLSICHPTGILTEDGIRVTLNNATDGCEVIFGLTLEKEEPAPIIPTYTVNAIMTNATTDEEMPVSVNEGDNYTFIIKANPGTTFENLMCVLDKGTENQTSWVIDLNTDSTNIFDWEIENVPHIENDGNVVVSRKGDHYEYTVNLKDIRNNYEIRFSTINIDVGQ